MKRRLLLETLEDRLLLATLVVQGTDEADTFEFSPGRISVNGVEQVYDTRENPRVLIDGLSGESTRRVALEGSLERTGDVATTAQRIQTGILGTNFYSAPTTQASVELAAAPLVIGFGTGLNGNYRYYVTFASTAGGPGAGIESRPSPVSDSINVANGYILVGGMPTTNSAEPRDAMWQVRRIYRNLSTGDGTFHYLGEIPDTTSDATIIDDFSDSAIASNAILDLDGPKITSATLLRDVLSRDAASTTYRWFAENSTGRMTFGLSGELIAATNQTVSIDGRFAFELDFSRLSIGPSQLTTLRDTIMVTGSSGDDTAIVRPGFATVSGTTFEIRVANVPQISVLGGGGIDIAHLYDSAGNDRFLATPDEATLGGLGFENRVEGFEYVHAYAKAGGDDVAELSDGEGDDRFRATPTYGRLAGNVAAGPPASPSRPFVLRAKFFDYVHAYARNGGYDRAYLFDSAGDDVFVKNDTYGKLRGDGFLNRAKFFESIRAYASAGDDEARLFAGRGDHLSAKDNRADLWTTVAATVYNFDQVRAVSGDASNKHDVQSIDYLLRCIGPWLV